ncbi:MAG: caspase family protein [Bacteroidota bacterium]
MKLFNFLFWICLSLCKTEAQSFQAVIQKGHGEAVKSAGFTKDGKYLITASRDKSAKLWDAFTGMEIRSFLGHDHTVNDFSVGDGMLATSSADGTVGIWKLETGELIWESSSYKQFVTTVDFSPDGKLLAVGGYADSLDIYRVKDFEIIKKFPVNSDRGVGYGVNASFSPDGKYLAVGEDQRTVKLYNTSDWSLKYELKPANGYCGGCGTYSAFSPDGRYLLKLSNGTSFVKYDLQSGSEIYSFKEDFDDIVSTIYHPNGNFYLAATADSIFVFSNKSNKLISQLTYEAEVNHVSFHPIKKQLLIVIDKVVILTDFDGNEIQRFDGILNRTTTGLDYDLGNYWQHYIAKWVKYRSARFLDNQMLFVGKTGDKARKWNVKNASIAMEYNGHEKGILCFEKIDEQTIATGAGDGKIIIWDEASGKQKKVIDAHREPIFDLALSNDGQLLASGSWDGVISFWNTNTWERYSYIYNEGASAYSLEFTENDAYLITGLLDKSLKLLEIETKRFVKELVGHTDNVTSIQVNGSEILTTSWDGKIILWDLYSGLIKKRFNPNKPVFEAHMLGDQLISAGADRQITFWDLKNEKVISKLRGHQAEINGLQIDGNLIMSTDVDGITKFWDLGKKKELFEHIQIGKNDWMIKTPDGFFDATDDAISNIHFVSGMGVVGAEQVMKEFYVPGLAKDIFSTQRGGKKSMGNLINQFPPPILKLSGLVQNDNAKLYLKAEDAGGGIVDLKLFHNGRRVILEPQIQKVRSDKNAKIYTIEFPLVAGHNEFIMTASSKSNVESNKASVKLFSDSKVPGSTCHILAVGINEYENQSLNLNYAKTDAFSFAKQMKEQGEAIYANVELHQIYDREATKENILERINHLKSQISVNDVFVFYYAGHGSMVDNKFYLVSSGAKRLYDSDKIGEFGIEANVLQQAMLEIEALKQLIIMDACQSGGAGEILLQRGAPEEKAIAQLSRSSGIHVMASAGSEQYATEFESLGHGLFTYALLKGISGEADGSPKDGKVTIYELKGYLDDQVPELSIQYKGSPQYPHTFSRGQDFPIVIVED